METYIRDRHDDVHRARCEAKAKMLAGLDESEDIAAEVGVVGTYAFWWGEPVTGIDHEGLDPVEALWRARDTAHLDAITAANTVGVR